MNKKKHFQKFAYKDSRRWLRRHSPHFSALHGTCKDPYHITQILSEWPSREREFELFRNSKAYRRNKGGLVNLIEPLHSYRFKDVIAVREAREITAHRMQHGHTALKLISLMYWPRGGHRALQLSEAADALGLTFHQACKLHDGFLRLVEERRFLKKRWNW